MRLLLCVFLISCGPDASLGSYDFITKHGLKVGVGRQNAPTIKMVEAWTRETLEFWYDHFPCKRLDGLDILERTYAYFHDMDYILSWNEKFSGLARHKFALIDDTWYSEILISNGSFLKIRAVFVHELSHILLFEWAKYDLGTGESHDMFKEFGLDGQFTY